MKLPIVISVDAFGTLFYPRQHPVKTYHKIASAYNINKPYNELKIDFFSAFSQLKSQYPNYGLQSSMPLLYPEHSNCSNEISQSEIWWSLVINQAFAPYKIPYQMVSQLMSFFSGPAYIADSSLVSALRKVAFTSVNTNTIQTRSSHPILLVNSNGDPRVRLVLDYLKLVGPSPALFSEDMVYLSFETAKEKPNRETFDAILDDLMLKGMLKYDSREELKTRCWHIGDTLETDLKGSISAGWNGVLKKDGAFDEALLNVQKSHIISDFSDLNSIWGI